MRLASCSILPFNDLIRQAERQIHIAVSQIDNLALLVRPGEVPVFNRAVLFKAQFNRSTDVGQDLRIRAAE
jgi:hypothetical protein